MSEASTGSPALPGKAVLRRVNRRTIPLRVPVPDVEVELSPSSIDVLAHHVVGELQLTQDYRAEDGSFPRLPLPERRRD